MRRPQPARDGKVLAAWNGLLLAALAEAGRALPDGERFTLLATRAAAFLWTRLRGADGRLRRSWKDDRTGSAAVLEDHTHLADGLLALYETTFDERWFEAARDLMEVALDALRGCLGRLLRHRGRRRGAHREAAQPPGQRHPVGQRDGRHGAAAPGRR